MDVREWRFQFHIGSINIRKKSLFLLDKLTIIRSKKASTHNSTIFVGHRRLKDTL